MNIDGAIFDADGTLLDSMFIWDRIGEEYLRARGIEPRKNLNEIFKNMSLHQAAVYYQQEYGLTDSTDEIMEGVNGMIAHYYADQVPLKKGAVELLEALRRCQVKMCIATATDRPLVAAALQRNGILDYFAHIYTCNSVGHGKDEPHIYEAARCCLGTPKESTWVFEDALYAVKTARKAGFPVVGVWDASERHTAEVESLSTRFIRSFEEMREWL